jgi:hypothetical protein
VRNHTIRLLAVAVVVLIAGITTVAVTHHGSPLGLGRETGAPGATPPDPLAVNQPVSPPPAAVGNGATRAPAPKATRAARSNGTGQSGAVTAGRASADTYPGAVTCPQSGLPSPNAYAWECTHSDGTPVRWRTDTITMWTDGLTVDQMAALRAAQSQWAQHTGLSLAPASSESSAQLLLTEVPTLDALPDLGSDVVEYAVTEVHQTGGYYDHATVRVANASLGADTWLDTLLHELGHVAGLGHVLDNNQIMRRVVGVPQGSYGDGDVAGLETERPR